MPYFRDLVPAPTAARRLVGHWKYSQLQDHSLRRTLDFLRERNVKIILYQLPVHPAVAEQIRSNPQYTAGYNAFLAYVDTLGVPPEARIQLLDISECGSPVEGMRDMTHFNEIGANIYSHWLGSRLRTMLESVDAAPLPE
jgi:hypothetical protein